MIRYMHVERIGNDDVENILNGTVYIQPKLDGSNGQIYFDSETKEIVCASRNQELNHEKTNQGFWNYVFDNGELYTEYFKKHPHHILYGEWLVPHTLKTYRKDAWNKFYVFDVFDSYSGMFISYDKYFQELVEFNISFVPVIGKLFNPKEEDLIKYLTQNQFLIEDGKGYGEGIVIKNYEFVNKYGRVTWAKLVRNEFKEEHNIVMGYPDNESIPIELQIAEQFVTEGRLNKIKAKILEDKNTGWRNEYIPQYLNTVWFEIITEEMWNILKKFKNPKIDFTSLNRFVIKQIKEIDKEIF